jgi:hypothetical protein
MARASGSEVTTLAAQRPPLICAGECARKGTETAVVSSLSPQVLSAHTGEVQRGKRAFCDGQPACSRRGCGGGGVEEAVAAGARGRCGGDRAESSAQGFRTVAQLHQAPKRLGLSSAGGDLSRRRRDLTSRSRSRTPRCSAGTGPTSHEHPRLVRSRVWAGLPMELVR